MERGEGMRARPGSLIVTERVEATDATTKTEDEVGKVSTLLLVPKTHDAPKTPFDRGAPRKIRPRNQHSPLIFPIFENIATLAESRSRAVREGSRINSRKPIEISSASFGAIESRDASRVVCLRESSRLSSREKDGRVSLRDAARHRITLADFPVNFPSWSSRRQP